MFTNKMLDVLKDTEKQLTETIKTEYNKLSNVEKKDVIETTNNMADKLCDLFGISEENRKDFHVTDEMFSNVEKKCSDTCDKVHLACSNTCEKVKDTCSKVKKTVSTVTKDDVINAVNDTIKSISKTLGISENDIPVIDKDTIDEDKVHINVRNFDNGSEVTMKYSDFDNTEADTDDGETEDKTDIVYPESPSTCYCDYDCDECGAGCFIGDECDEECDECDDVTCPDNPDYVPDSADVLYRLREEAGLETDDIIEQNEDNPINYMWHLMWHIGEILDDTENKNYKIHKHTAESPAAVEVTVEINSKYKNNSQIFNDIKDNLKEDYGFSDVHVSVTDEDNGTVAHFFMVLE